MAKKKAFLLSQDLVKLYAEKTFDLVNIGAGALLFGQFLSEKDFSWLIAGFGFAILLSGYLFAFLAYREFKEK